MRNKHTNRALKKGARHYSDHRGNTGFIAVEKRSASKAAKLWLVIVLAVIIGFYFLTK